MINLFYSNSRIKNIISYTILTQVFCCLMLVLVISSTSHAQNIRDIPVNVVQEHIPGLIESYNQYVKKYSPTLDPDDVVLKFLQDSAVAVLVNHAKVLQRSNAEHAEFVSHINDMVITFIASAAMDDLGRCGKVDSTVVRDVRQRVSQYMDERGQQYNKYDIFAIRALVYKEFAAHGIKGCR